MSVFHIWWNFIVYFHRFLFLRGPWQYPKLLYHLLEIEMYTEIFLGAIKIFK